MSHCRIRIENLLHIRLQAIVYHDARAKMFLSVLVLK